MALHDLVRELASQFAGATAVLGGPLAIAEQARSLQLITQALLVPRIDFKDCDVDCVLAGPAGQDLLACVVQRLTLRRTSPCSPWVATLFHSQLLPP